LLAREPIFHKPELGTSREDYTAQTAEDFWEVGATGQVYDRDFVIDTVVSRGKVAGDEGWACGAGIRMAGRSSTTREP